MIVGVGEVVIGDVVVGVGDIVRVGVGLGVVDAVNVWLIFAEAIVGEVVYVAITRPVGEPRSLRGMVTVATVVPFE